MAAFAYGRDMRTNGPVTGDMPRPLLSELPGGGTSGEGWPAELALRYELGGLNSLGVRRALRLGLRGVADGLGQHFVQLSLGLLRFALGWLPLCHVWHVGMPMRGASN